MRKNQVLSLFQQNQTAINCWLIHPSPMTAELIAHQGFDSITIDMQHGMIGFESALAMLQAISTTPVTPLVRVPWLDPGIIMKMLDAGAYGVICPMIETAEQTREFVATCRYPGKGNRSFGPSRAMIYAGSDYPEKAEETILPMVMIETRQALDNLDDILSTEGLGAIYIGPFDLSYALGCQPQPDHYEAPVMEAIEHILACSKKHNVPAAIHCMGPQFADRMRKKGFSLVTAGCDADFVRAGATHTIQSLRP
ncbi:MULTISPECIES: HpcH/HpaI aldolase family protein [unclassified Endozoicomonas]|uniref:HpcH/HpaI aldolase family protein n=1 Tax=unclassified Endozoicomonas TaxID=2644528 RepID=UPI003BB6FD11